MKNLYYVKRKLVFLIAQFPFLEIEIQDNFGTSESNGLVTPNYLQNTL